ncbi:hypothetical protein ACFQ49_03625 [Kroppenstedtia eburnea]|uniref:Uncharacterized protein n=1 Tax=Kroppenstedtia eburnea TaxID=714067 RepID=A0A1N7J750_9BACL|nr:hypothetical protein [Kroppenstedtia eburnea]EGK13013.1 ATP synthase F0 sector subunit B [Desmospora sp. 8437]QKI82562.1 hypothetical protein GXN75_11495 [Kroppenstedtia eburnea]SIS45071.1 hypothetical protein SAMN05421790_101793 [Kroppenstedtia eburnea]
MFRLFNFNNEDSKGKEHADHARKEASADEQKLRETMNEVASEVGVSAEGNEQSPQNAEKLGEQIKKELKKRT